MTKRADGRWSRRERDFYPTPEKAVLPLLAQFPRPMRFYEPCAGNGSLSQILVTHGHQCIGQSDLFPKGMIERWDARLLTRGAVVLADVIITNPPWKIPDMHELIDHLRQYKPTWMLIYADWLFTQRAAPLLAYASKIVAIGRVKWIAGSRHDGFDNCCWVRFEGYPSVTTFIGQQP